MTLTCSTKTTEPQTAMTLTVQNDGVTVKIALSRHQVEQVRRLCEQALSFMPPETVEL